MNSFKNLSSFTFRQKLALVVVNSKKFDRTEQKVKCLHWSLYEVSEKGSRMPIAKDHVELLQVKKLLQCVRQQDYAQIARLCAKGVPLLINYNEPAEGLTALIAAALANDEAMVRFLLASGAHPNLVDLRGRSALMRAAELGHVQAMAVLREAGADAGVRDAEGRDVLFCCLAAPTNRHDRWVLAFLGYAIQYSIST